MLRIGDVFFPIRYNVARYIRETSHVPTLTLCITAVKKSLPSIARAFVAAKLRPIKHDVLSTHSSVASIYIDMCLAGYPNGLRNRGDIVELALRAPNIAAFVVSSYDISVSDLLRYGHLRTMLRYCPGEVLGLILNGIAVQVSDSSIVYESCLEDILQNPDNTALGIVATRLNVATHLSEDAKRTTFLRTVHCNNKTQTDRIAHFVDAAGISKTQIVSWIFPSKLATLTYIFDTYELTMDDCLRDPKKAATFLNNLYGRGNNLKMCHWVLDKLRVDWSAKHWAKDIIPRHQKYTKQDRARVECLLKVVGHMATAWQQHLDLNKLFRKTNALLKSLDPESSDRDDDEEEEDDTAPKKKHKHHHRDGKEEERDKGSPARKRAKLSH